MDDYIIISNLNDFIFCPASIYFHNLYGSMDTMLYQGPSQINGTNAHKAVDHGTYSEKKNIVTSLEIYSEKYNIVGKIDIYDSDSKTLTERKKKIVFYFPSQGDKMSFQNDNLIIKDKEKKTKFQVTCYRIFLIFVVGDTTITTGLLSRAKKFGFSLCLMNRNMKMYQFISARMEGNTILRSRQYEYHGMEIGRHITWNKIMNQRTILMSFRSKNEWLKEGIVDLDGHISKLRESETDLYQTLGIEGSAARTYFSRIFDNVKWNGRKARIKCDYVNASLDIGYTILFNIVDALLNVYGFDEYYGVLHKCFYMRKSLVCDLMEPMRPIIDYATRKAINLRQIKVEDFQVYNKRYILDWKKSPEYTQVYLKAILEYKEQIFLYIQGYYRAVMKQKPANEYPLFLLE